MSESESVMLPEVDSAPQVWVEEHPEPTEEEIALGNQLGETINTEDDDDVTGAVAESDVEPPR